MKANQPRQTDHPLHEDDSHTLSDASGKDRIKLWLHNLTGSVTIGRKPLSVSEREQEAISELFQSLEPQSQDLPRKSITKQRLYSRIESEKEKVMLEKIKTSKRLQRQLSFGAGALVLIGSFMFAPVRAFASDLLSIFRVEEFTVVSVDEERIEEIAEAANGLEFMGEPEVIVDGGEPYAVSSLDEASSIVGFTPATLDGYGEPTTIFVMNEHQMAFNPDIATMRELFELLGLDPELLPAELEGETITATLHESVAVLYGDAENNTGLVFGQTPSPSIDVPDGVDVQQLGVAMFQLLGMSADDAERLANDIDWTTTLVLPVPAAQADRITEVVVNGSTGLLFEEHDYYDEVNEEWVEGSNVLLWEDNGYLMVLEGQGDLLSVADDIN